MSLGKRYRHFGRYRQIANVLIKHGFGFIAGQIGLDEFLSYPRRLLRRNDEFPEALSRGERIRKVLEELGPTFIKVGQLLSTRPDMVPEDIVRELEKLQDQVPPFPFEQAAETIEKELGQPTEKVFSRIDPEVLAAASIGQVHQARLISGEDVVVKVQRPGIRGIIETDLEVLADLALLADRRSVWGKIYRFSEAVDEFARTLRAELDYTIEGRNADRLARNFGSDPGVVIPEVHWDFTTRRVLTMQYLPGIKISDLEALDREGFNRTAVADRLARAVFKQVLEDGFFHADPHPGNVAVIRNARDAVIRDARDRHSGSREPRIVFYDFGMVGRLTSAMKEQLADLVIAFMKKDSDAVLAAVIKMGVVPEDADLPALRRGIDDLREKYYEVPLSKVDLGEAVTDVFYLAFRHRVRMPVDFSLLGKALLAAEGAVKQIDPEFKIVQVAEPFGRKLLAERLSPVRIGREAIRRAEEYRDLAGELPRQFRDLLAQIRAGRLTLGLDLRDLDRSLRKLDRIGNRLSFSIVLLSFSIVMSGLIIGASLGGRPSALSGIPAIEIGFGIATLLLLGLLVSIFRSGRL